MARIELRDVTIYIQDGFSGSAVIETATPSDGDNNLNVNTVVTTDTPTTMVPVGGRFTINSGTTNQVYTISAETNTSNTVNNVVFSPNLATAATVPSLADVLTFLPQRIEVKIGEGNLTWTEAKEYEYLRDRGNLDTVKEGDEQPVEISMEFVYEYVKASSGGDITPVDALKQSGEAAGWISSASDQCEPYAIDILAKHCVPCGTDEDEDALFQDFRYEGLDFDLQAATIAVSGKCNISEATMTRSDDPECA